MAPGGALSVVGIEMRGLFNSLANTSIETRS
jgi:hypothetical protein